MSGRDGKGRFAKSAEKPSTTTAMPPVTDNGTFKPQRAKDGKWLAGQGSPNPGGRPLGLKNRMSRQILDRLNEEMGPVLESILTAAKNGDQASARFVVGLVQPRATRPAVDIQADMGPLDTARALAEGHAQLVQAAAAGLLDADLAAGLSSLLNEQRKFLETVQLSDRMEKLEKSERVVIDLGPALEEDEKDTDFGEE